MIEAGIPAKPADGNLRILMVGDLVGKPGLRMACDSVSWIRKVLRADALVVNAENAADGSGLRCKDYRRLCDAGVDLITLGDHAFRKREIMEVLDKESNIVRPANLPQNAPGKGTAVVTIEGVGIAVTSLLGRVFMKPVDCPFNAAKAELDGVQENVAIHLVDFHAEATSDMQLMGRFLDGQVAAVLGTHTHVATADEQILPKGSGFQCDVGMTGPHDGIIGRRFDRVMETTYTLRPTSFNVAKNDRRISSSIIQWQPSTGQAVSIERCQVLAEEIPDLEQLSASKATS